MQPILQPSSVDNLQELDLLRRNHNALVKIIFNGQMIEIDISQDDHVQRLPPEMVKEKWRRKQILLRDQGRGGESSEFDRNFDGIEYISRQDPSYDLCNYGSDDCERAQQSQMLVWSGWLSKRCMSILSGTVFKQWRKRWFVLALNQGRYSIEYYVEESSQTCAMRLKRSFLIDQRETAKRKWISTQSIQAYLSIPITGGTGQLVQLVLASNNAGEADFLVASINSVVLKPGHTP
jgi:hypothetical protein